MKKAEWIKRDWQDRDKAVTAFFKRAYADEQEKREWFRNHSAKKSAVLAQDYEDNFVKNTSNSDVLLLIVELAWWKNSLELFDTWECKVAMSNAAAKRKIEVAGNGWLWDEAEYLLGR